MKKKEKREFGNARGIRNLFETLVVSQANRIVEMEHPSVEELTSIKEEDIAWLTVLRLLASALSFLPFPLKYQQVPHWNNPEKE